MASPAYYFTDSLNSKIHVVDTNGIINDLSITSSDSNYVNNGGFEGLWGCCLDPTGRFLYVVDEAAEIVYQIDLQNSNTLVTAVGGGVTFVSGSPVANANVRFHDIYEVRCDANGNLLVADVGFSTPMLVNLGATSINVLGTTVPAGDSWYVQAAFNCSACLLDYGMDHDSAGNWYFTDQGNNGGLGNVIYQCTPAGVIAVFAGTIGSASNSGDGGSASSCSMDSPFQLSIDKNDMMYVIPNGQNGGSAPVIRAINLSGVTQTVFGKTIAPGNIDTIFTFTGGVGFTDPWYVQPDNQGNLYICDVGGSGGISNPHTLCNIHMLNSASVYSVVAGQAGQGPSFCGNSGQGGPATSAFVGESFGVTIAPVLATFCGGMASPAVGNPLI